MVSKFWRQFPNNKFLKQVIDGGYANPDGGIFQRQSRSIAILLWIVEIGKAAGRQASEDVGVVWLPAAIVTLADHRIGDRIERPGSLAAGSLVKIARILLQKRWQYGGSDERAGYHVGIAGAEALCVTLSALSISGEVILRLLNSGSACDHHQGEGIHYRS